MPDLDINKIAQALDDEELVPGDEREELSDEPEEGEGQGEDEEGEEGEQEDKPSFMPNLAGANDAPAPNSIKHKKSMIDTATAISAVAILKQELHQIGCTLKDYRIEFTVNGIDINNITVGTDNVEELRSKVGELDDEEKARVASKVTTLALIAINDSFKEKVKDELGLNISFFEYDNADMGAASLGIPEPQPEDAIGDIANSIDVDMPPEMGGAAPGVTPGSEEMPVEPGLEGAPEIGGPPPAAAPAPEAAAPMAAAPPATPAAPAVAPTPV